MDGQTNDSSSRVLISEPLVKEINLTEYKKQIAAIKSNLASKQEQFHKNASLRQLKVLILSNVHNIQEEAVSIVANTNIELWVKQDILSTIAEYIRTLILNSDLNSLASVYQLWKNNDDKFSTIVYEICQDKEYSLSCKRLLLQHLVPEIMASPLTEPETKNLLIDVSFMFASGCPINSWTKGECVQFLSDVNRYIKNISDLRDANFDNWHNLWKFLVRILGKELHSSMSLVNKLLRVVEHAFRNSSCDQRLKGYDCWKELIDNVSLDKNHLSSSKQIRLLLTPLKAKFSKQESVIVKRFEVFVYLLEKLQENGVLILKEFLEFCFGGVGEDSDASKTGQGRSVSQIWIESAKVLLAIIGHSHVEVDHCLCTDGTINGPLINTENISAYYAHIINSVSECCKLLKEVKIESHNHIILDCFWRSTLNLIFKSDLGGNPNCLTLLNKVMENNIMDIDPYNNNIAWIMFRVIMDIDRGLIQDFLKQNLTCMLKIVFCTPFSNNSYDIVVSRFADTIFKIEQPEEKAVIKNEVLQCFTKYKTVENNVHICAYLWINLARELEDYPKEKSLDFLLWPALHLHRLQDHEVTKNEIVENYKVLVTKYIEKCEEMRIAVLRAYEKLLRNIPLLSTNILLLITLFSINFEDREGTSVIFEIFSLILLLPSGKQGLEQRKIIQNYLKRCLDEKSGILKIDQPDIIRNFSNCIIHLFKHKLYDCLANLCEYLKAIPDNVKKILSKHLLSEIMNIFEKETDLVITSQIFKIVELLRNVTASDKKKGVSSPLSIGGRSAKISKLAKSCHANTNEPIALRLFGKDVNTFTPLNVKGSQLKNVTASKSPKTPSKVTTPSIMDENSDQFVLINSEVKIEPEKLTEHQKESLKKRREDIPALYEDLSQSQTQSLTGVIRLDNNQTDFKVPNNVEVKPEQNNEDNSLKKKTEAVEGKKDPKSLPATPKIEDAKKELTKEEIIEMKMQAELKKLQMNIVGAEEFVSPITKRRRSDVGPRSSRKSNVIETQSKSSSKDCKRLSLSTNKSKKSAPLEKKNNSESQIKEKKKSRQSLSNKVEEKELTPNKKKKKRKRTNSNTDSEDVIESSQESVTPLNNSAKLISFVKKSEDKRKSFQEKTVNENETRTAQKKDLQETDIIEETENQNTELQEQEVEKSTQSQDTQTQETENYEPDPEFDTKPKLDLPEKVELTEEQKALARMDTASLTFPDTELSAIDPNFASDMNETKIKDVIIGNISLHEPETESSILNNENIEVSQGECYENEPSSPVRDDHNALPSSPVTGDTPNRTSELLNSTSDISPIGSKSSSDDENETFKPVVLKFDDEEVKSSDDVPEKSENLLEKDVPDSEQKPPEVLSTGNDISVQSISKRSAKFFEMVRNDSPMPHRLFKRKSGPHMSPSASRIKKLMSGMKQNAPFAMANNINKEDLLTFTREIPSPLAVPKSSILKRKYSDSDDGLSPYPKRKRVNFSDPCTTSSKVFIKEEINQCQLFELESPSDIDLFDFDKNTDNLTETDNIETEQSLQITNTTMLRKDQSIYPELEQCDEDVFEIVRKVTSPIFIDALMSQVKGKNIHTIGDMARQSEMEINKFPFKTPVVENVYKALDNHYRKNCKNKTNISVRELNGDSSSPCDSKKEQGIQVDAVEVNLEDEVKEIIQKVKSQKMPLDNFWQIISLSLGEQNILTLIKTQTNDIFEKEECPDVTERSSEDVGRALKQHIDTKPLTNVVGERSLEEVQTALWECVHKEIFKRQELLDTCFIPFITPVDLNSFFNRLNSVELQNIALRRLNTESFDSFVERLFEKFTKQKRIVLKKFSTEELADGIVQQYQPKDVVELVTKIFDKDVINETDDLVRFFKLVSGKVASKLPGRVLMDLSIEFQRKIPVRD